MSMPRFWRLQMLTFLLVAVAAGLWFGGPGLFSTLQGVFLRTTVAQSGVVERAFVGKGIMVRSEQVVTSPSGGLVTLLVEDTQRVRSGQVVAEVRQDVRQHVEQALQHLDAKIVALDREAQATASDMRRRLDQLERNIQELEGEVANALAAGRNDVADILTHDLRQVRQTHSATETEFAQIRTSLEDGRHVLQQERAAIQASATAEVTIIRADTPGVISYAYDGLEDMFVPGQASEALWTAPDEHVALHLIREGDSIAAGSVLFRLIDNFAGHIFVRFDHPPELKAGQAVWLRFGDISPPGVRARVQSIHVKANQIGVWFSLDAYQDSYGVLRILGTVTVVTQRVQGIVVPKSVLGQRGETTGLFVEVDGRPIFRQVTVLGEDDLHVVVDHVPAGSRVITNPQRLFRQ